MIKMVKFMLCAFYHNFINKYMNKNSSVQEKKKKWQSTSEILKALWNWAVVQGVPGKCQDIHESHFQGCQGLQGGCEDVTSLGIDFQGLIETWKVSSRFQLDLSQRNNSCLHGCFILVPGRSQCLQGYVSQLGKCSTPPMRGSRLSTSPPPTIHQLFVGPWPLIRNIYLCQAPVPAPTTGSLSSPGFLKPETPGQAPHHSHIFASPDYFLNK